MKNFFDFSNIKGDLLGGITAGVVALPLALAFGASSGLGAAYGLYGAIFVGFFAAVFGGTSTQISGPTAPMTAVSMVVIAGIVAAFEGNLEKALPVIMMVFLLAGLIQIVMGFFGMGMYIKYIPYPVISGFMTAIGVLILFGELFNVLGYYPHEDKAFVESFKPQAEERILDKILLDEAQEGILVMESFEETIERSHEVNEETIATESMILAKEDASGVMGKIKNLPRALQHIKWYEVLLALLTIVLVYGLKRVITKIPSTLLALLLVSVLAYVLKEYQGIGYAKISEIPSGFPEFFGMEIIQGFNFTALKPFILAAFSLAFLGAIDSLLTSLVADNMTKTKHKPNQELIGQGVGNAIAALFKGLPGAGATIRTVVNINAGGKTKISGMIAGVLLLVISLLISDAASQIPKAVLSGILVTVGFGVMDYKGLRAIPHMEKDLKFSFFGFSFKLSSEVLVLFTVLILAVFWDLIVAVGIGLVFSALNFMKKMGDIAARESKSESLVEAQETLWEDEFVFPETMKEEVYIKHLEGPLFFGYVTEFHDLVTNLPESTTHVIFRMDKVPYIDQTGLYALEQILIDFKKSKKKVLLVGVKPNVMLRLRSLDIIPNLVSEELHFETFEESIQWLKDNIEYE